MHKVLAVNVTCFKCSWLLWSWVSHYTWSGSWIFDFRMQTLCSATVKPCGFELLRTLNFCLSNLKRYGAKRNCVLLYEGMCAECDFVKIMRVGDRPLLSLMAERREFFSIFDLPEPRACTKLSGAILLHCLSKCAATSISNVGMFWLPIYILVMFLLWAVIGYVALPREPRKIGSGNLKIISANLGGLARILRFICINKILNYHESNVL